MTFVIFGLGAVGSNLLLNLAKLYSSSEFIGVDYDKVEDRNVATQVYFQNQIGMPKVNAMQIILNLKVRKIKYTPMNTKILSPSDPLIESIFKDTLWVDCFDNSASRKLLEGVINCLHIGFSPTYTAEIIWGEAYTAPKDVDPKELDICEMLAAIPFVNYVVSMATFTIQNFIESGRRDQWLILNKYELRRL